MNEADKERYFREKEAYERVTGQVLPVAKVVRGNLHLSLSHFVFIFPMTKVVRENLRLRNTSLKQARKPRATLV